MGEEQEQSGWAFETLAIHAGQEPDAASGAVVPPISLSTTFAQSEVGVHKGYEYSRSGNPTRTAMETQIASLEVARHGLAFASGLAAEDNVMRLLTQGQRVLLGNDAYGGTFRLISKVWSPLGFPWTAVDLGDLDAVVANWPDDTGLVWLESPTNPLLTCFDIEAICRDRPRAWRPGRRRQHVRHAVPAAADHARCRHRPALGDQVPRWSQRRGRRFPRRRRRRDRRAPAIHPERCGGDPLAVRLLPRAARRQDARGPDGPTLPERTRRRRPVGCPPDGRSCVVSAAPRPPRPRRCGQADAATTAGWSASP